MAYILAVDGRDDDVGRQFDKYREYLRANKASFPKSAFAIASLDWYFNFNERRCPHDAWLESLELREDGTGARQASRKMSLTMRLKGAYHDGHLVLRYPTVYAYSFGSGDCRRVHGDWRYDELRLSASGNLLHEIEWSSVGVERTWLIEASDLELVWLPSWNGPRWLSCLLPRARA